MEKRNIIENGRTPLTTEKTAEVVDKAAEKFSFKQPPADPNAVTKKMPRLAQTKEADDAAKAAD